MITEDYTPRRRKDESDDVSRAVRGVLRLQAEAEASRSPPIGWRSVVVPIAAAAMALALAVSAASAQERPVLPMEPPVTHEQTVQFFVALVASSAEVRSFDGALTPFVDWRRRP